MALDAHGGLHRKVRIHGSPGRVLEQVQETGRGFLGRRSHSSQGAKSGQNKGHSEHSECSLARTKVGIW